MLWHKVSSGVKLWQIFSNFDLGRVIGASARLGPLAKALTVILHNLIVRGGGAETWQPDFAVIYCLALFSWFRILDPFGSAKIYIWWLILQTREIRCFLICNSLQVSSHSSNTDQLFSILQIKSQDKDLLGWSLRASWTSLCSVLDLNH